MTWTFPTLLDHVGQCADPMSHDFMSQGPEGNVTQAGWQVSFMFCDAVHKIVIIPRAYQFRQAGSAA